MTIRESVKKEIDTLPEEGVYAVRDFVLFQKYRGINTAVSLKLMTRHTSI